MRYKKLGNSSLDVSVVGQGTWALGNDFFGDVDESEGIKVEDLADLMIGLGASDAIMFDGGDSATIMENGDYVIRGRAGAREMCDGLAILAPRTPVTAAEGSTTP